MQILGFAKLAEGDTPRATQTPPKATPKEPQVGAGVTTSTLGSHPARQPSHAQPDFHTPAGIAAAHDQRVLLARAEQARRKHFVVDDVRPYSWQWPVSWGQPVWAIAIAVQGIRAVSYVFPGGERCRRAAGKLHGYDD